MSDIKEKDLVMCEDVIFPEIEKVGMVLRVTDTYIRDNDYFRGSDGNVHWKKNFIKVRREHGQFTSKVKTKSHVHTKLRP